MARKPYPSDLTDEQWSLIKPLIPDADPGGRPRSVGMREVVNAILYLVDNVLSYAQFEKAVLRADGVVVDATHSLENLTCPR